MELDNRNHRRIGWWKIAFINYTQTTEANPNKLNQKNYSLVHDKEAKKSIINIPIDRASETALKTSTTIYEIISTHYYQRWPSQRTTQFGGHIFSHTWQLPIPLANKKNVYIYIELKKLIRRELTKALVARAGKINYFPISPIDADVINNFNRFFWRLVTRKFRVNKLGTVERPAFGDSWW